MKDKILIDGWNVAWKIDDIRKKIPDDLKKARELLNALVKIHFAGKKSVIKIIYDGKAGVTENDGYPRGIDIQFSKDPEKADHLIIQHLQRQKNARQWTVITSDRILSTRVRSLGAQVISSESFIQKLRSPQPEIPMNYKHNPQLGSEDIKFWMEQFNANKKNNDK
jgi:predicted RNA-binding protein with PIN domain